MNVTVAPWNGLLEIGNIAPPRAVLMDYSTVKYLACRYMNQNYL